MPLTEPKSRFKQLPSNMPALENQSLLTQRELRPPTASRFRITLRTVGMILILLVIGWYLVAKKRFVYYNTLDYVGDIISVTMPCKLHDNLIFNYLISYPFSSLRRNDATYIVHNANIHTMDDQLVSAGAFVVKNGKFVDVGTSKAILKKWSGIKAINLNNRTVIPGLIDAHGHLMELGYILGQPVLNNANSIEEIRVILKDHVKSSGVTYHDDGPWLQGWGWDQTRFPTKSFPTAADLDIDILTSIPIILRRRDGHAAWINDRVIAILRRNGVDLNQINVDGGEIVRDPGLGVLLDNAMDLAERYIPPANENQNQVALASAIKALHAVGITAIHDAGVSPKTIEFYKRSYKAGRFLLRNYIMIECPGRNVYCGNEVPKFETIDGILKLSSVKLFMDGALGSWGAAMLEPYNDNPTKSGILRTDPSIFPGLGYQVNTHCIGDRANRIILDAYERNLVAILGNDDVKLKHNNYRLRIEHAQILAPSDIERSGKLAILPSMQPTHGEPVFAFLINRLMADFDFCLLLQATSDMEYVESRIGHERAKLGAYAWRSFLNSGVPALPLGSDFPVESPDPRKGIYSAVTRQYADGSSPHGPKGWFPDQRLSRIEALRGFTLDAAFAAFMEDKVGSISKNKFADFVVFDQDILSILEHNIIDAQVLATVIGGFSYCNTPKY
ncbi:amidohydrolase 3 [Endogone sp. FLAS-F59071]|nr:amidohydrolase 3 [Endogone sp. FLAS-F59071]|eukprot:RUS19984.1 amidohydrolase 3 [Endogone sp. FLAS-F59071]